MPSTGKWEARCYGCNVNDTSSNKITNHMNKIRPIRPFMKDCFAIVVLDDGEWNCYAYYGSDAGTENILTFPVVTAYDTADRLMEAFGEVAERLEKEAKYPLKKG